MDRNTNNEAGSLMDKKSLAGYLRCTTRTVEERMRRGLPYLKLTARCVRFRLADVDAWLDSQRVVKFIA